ncbi:RNase H domain-containing protein [Trichonephila clavipes]|nr:RNase H domain-containing protein [Trichonephila clavipes]
MRSTSRDFLEVLSQNKDTSAVAVRIHSTSLITVCCLYLPPNTVIHQHDLNNLVDQLPAPFVILGDFNGHSTLWGSVKTNPRGRQIEQDLYNSDHFPVILSHDSDTGGKTFPPTYSYSRADWALFTPLAVIPDVGNLGGILIVRQRIRTSGSYGESFADIPLRRISWRSKRQKQMLAEKRNLHPDPSIHIGNIQIRVVSEVRFLGVIFDCKLTFLPHVLYLRKKCERSLNILKVLSNTLWRADRVSLLRVYQALILSRLDYGYVVYGYARASVLKRLDTIHHSAADNAARFMPDPMQQPVCYQDLRTSIQHYVHHIWQETWDQQILNKLHSIHPYTSHWAALPVRRHDVRLTRLRIGHTRFTHRHLLLGENAPECPSNHAMLTEICERNQGHIVEQKQDQTKKQVGKREEKHPSTQLETKFMLSPYTQ